jgi:hypothetical protein
MEKQTILCMSHSFTSSSVLIFLDEIPLLRCSDFGKTIHDLLLATQQRISALGHQHQRADCFLALHRAQRRRQNTRSVRHRDAREIADQFWSHCHQGKLLSRVSEFIGSHSQVVNNRLYCLFGSNDPYLGAFVFLFPLASFMLQLGVYDIVIGDEVSFNLAYCISKSHLIEKGVEAVDHNAMWVCSFFFLNVSN